MVLKAKGHLVAQVLSQCQFIQAHCDQGLLTRHTRLDKWIEERPRGQKAKDHKAKDHLVPQDQAQCDQVLLTDQNRQIEE